MTHCQSCQSVFGSSPRNLARDVEAAFPDCYCEQHSVGEESPGRIEDHETLYRMFTDPVDVDEFGQLARAAFGTAFGNGLSVIRDCADDEHIQELVSDILSVKPGKPFRKILAIFRVKCINVRTYGSMFKGNLSRAFCVYDQTVAPVLNVGGKPVPTHGTILSRRLFEPPVTRAQFENDCNDTLHRLIAIDRIAVSDFRSGLVERLNAQSQAGEFVRQT
jgi:hypothetical protein